MPEECIQCGERELVFVTANKWRCKNCEEYFDWAEIQAARD